jgi:hypothetical protein
MPDFPPAAPSVARAFFVASERRLVAKAFSFPVTAVFSSLVRSYQLCCGWAVVGPATFFFTDERHALLA